MTDHIEELRNTAFTAKLLYKCGDLSRNEARKRIMPYLNEVNRIGADKADKYNIRYRPVSFSHYMRSSY